MATDKDTQANFFTFGSLDIFQRAQTHLNPGGGICDINGIGGVCPGL